MKKNTPTCSRCGRFPAGRWARVLKTNRVVCAYCYEDLPLGADNLVIDDGLVRTWKETQELKRKRKG